MAHQIDSNWAVGVCLQSFHPLPPPNAHNRHPHPLPTMADASPSSPSPQASPAVLAAAAEAFVAVVGEPSQTSAISGAKAAMLPPTTAAAAALKAAAHAAASASGNASGNGNGSGNAAPAADKGKRPAQKKRCPKQRINLPKLAKDVLSDWLYDHLDFPYPTEDEKRELATNTDLSFDQVNNWFINSRARLWKPLVAHAKALVNKSYALKVAKAQVETEAQEARAAAAAALVSTMDVEAATVVAAAAETRTPETSTTPQPATPPAVGMDEDLGGATLAETSTHTGAAVVSTVAGGASSVPVPMVTSGFMSGAVSVTVLGAAPGVTFPVDGVGAAAAAAAAAAIAAAGAAAGVATGGTMVMDGITVSAASLTPVALVAAPAPTVDGRRSKHTSEKACLAPDARNVMQYWLVDQLKGRYPTENERHALMDQTGMTAAELVPPVVPKIQRSASFDRKARGKAGSNTSKASGASSHRFALDAVAASMLDVGVGGGSPRNGAAGVSPRSGSGKGFESTGSSGGRRSRAGSRTSMGMHGNGGGRGSGGKPPLAGGNGGADGARSARSSSPSDMTTSPGSGDCGSGGSSGGRSSDGNSSSDELMSMDICGAGGEELSSSGSMKHGNRKRGLLPSATKNVLQKWLEQHMEYPYPSRQDKQMLSAETGLTFEQVDNWFRNARKRVCKTMLSSSSGGRGGMSGLSLSSSSRGGTRSGKGRAFSMSTPVGGLDDGHDTRWMDLLSTASKALKSWQHSPTSSGSKKRDYRRGDRVESEGTPPGVHSADDEGGEDDERGDRSATAQRALEYPHHGIKRRCFSLHEHGDDPHGQPGGPSPSSSLEFGAFSVGGREFSHLLKGRDRAASESAIGALLPRSSHARRQRSLSRGDDTPYVSLININVSEVYRVCVPSGGVRSVLSIGGTKGGSSIGVCWSTLCD